MSIFETFPCAPTLGPQPRKTLKYFLVVIKVQFSGKKESYPAVRELLGPDNDADELVLNWYRGENTYIPPNPDHFFERAFLQRHLLYPEKLSSSGFLEQAGIVCNNAFVSDPCSREYQERLKRSNEYLLVALSDLSIWPDLSAEQLLSCRVLQWLEENSGIDLRHITYPVDQTMFGNHYLHFIYPIVGAKIRDEADIKDLTSRIVQMIERFNSIIADIETKERVGVIAPRECLLRLLDPVAKGMKKLENGGFIVDMVKNKFKASTDQEAPADLCSELIKVIEHHLTPMLSQYLVTLGSHVEKSTVDGGLWRLEGGDKLYRNRMKWFITTDISPEDCHQLGMDEVARVHKKIHDVITDMNNRGDMTLDGSKSVSENLTNLFKMERFFYKNKEEMVDDCKKALKLINEATSEYFGVKPQFGCLVEPIAAEVNINAQGFYADGPLDLSRPGAFMVNGNRLHTQLQFQMKSLTAHEAVPGHHTQISLKLENKELPYFRRVLPTTFMGFSEGWGLYAELLCHEVCNVYSPAIPPPICL